MSVHYIDWAIGEGHPAAATISCGAFYFKVSSLDYPFQQQTSR